MIDSFNTIRIGVPHINQGKRSNLSGNKESKTPNLVPQHPMIYRQESFTQMQEEEQQLPKNLMNLLPVEGLRDQ